MTNRPEDTERVLMMRYGRISIDYPRPIFDVDAWNEKERIKSALAQALFWWLP